MADDHDTDTDTDDTGTGEVSGATVIQLMEKPSEPAPEAPTPVEPSGASSAVVLVDRRMRDRRIAVRRDAGQRRLRRLAWALLPLAVLVTGVVVLHLPVLDVDGIEVVGSQQNPAATIAWASGIDRGDALATVDEQEAERRIERLSWVEEADVVREWPGTIRIAVRERQPAALIDVGEDQSAVVVDASGRVLDIGGAAPFGLIVLVGLEGPFREGGTLPSWALPALELATRLNQALPGAATAVTIDFEAVLTDGGVARFGSIEALADKLIALETILSDVDLSCLEVLDVRVPSSPAVRRGAC